MLSDVDRMDTALASYSFSHNGAVKAYFSGNGYDSDLNFKASDGNVIDVAIVGKDYCIRAYNPNSSSWNSIWSPKMQESSDLFCDSTFPSDSAIPTISVPGFVPELSVSRGDAYNKINLVITNDVGCVDGYPQFRVDYNTNGGAWTELGTWNYSGYFSMTTTSGNKYGFKAQARCYVSQYKGYSSSIVDGEAIYTIAVTEMPIVSSTTTGNNTTWTWSNNAACPSGTSAQYEYRLTSYPNAYDSGWIADADFNVVADTSTGQELYSVKVRSRCYGVSLSSNWSNQGWKSVPVTAFGLAWGEIYRYDSASSLAKTSDGGYIITGTTTNSSSVTDILLAKFDSNGNLSWNKTWGKQYSDYAKSVIQTSDGGYAVTGYSYNTQYNGNSVFVAKFDSNGNISWNKSWGSTYDYNRGNSIVQTSDGGLLIAGTQYLTSAIISKLDISGNILWAKTLGRSGSVVAESIILTTDGGYAITGTTEGFSQSDADIFLAKYDSSGTLSWTISLGASGNDIPYSLVQTPDGGYAITGYTYNSSYGENMMLVKFSSAGSYSWSRSWGGASSDDGYSLVAETDGSIIVTGVSVGKLLIAKYSSSGSLIWDKTINGAYDGRSIVKMPDGGYAIAGRGKEGSMFSDIFLGKFTQSGGIYGCSSLTCSDPNTPDVSLSLTLTTPSYSQSYPTITPRDSGGSYGAINKLPTFLCIP